MIKTIMLRGKIIQQIYLVIFKKNISNKKVLKASINTHFFIADKYLKIIIKKTQTLKLQI